MKTKKLSDCSGNTLSELRSLIYELQARIKDYSHVEDYLSKSVIVSLSKESDRLEQELARREDESETIFNRKHPELNP